MRLKFLKRSYFYDKDVYGYRSPRPFVSDDYTGPELENRNRNANLLRLVYAYRTNGHKLANLDPLNMTKQEYYLVTQSGARNRAVKIRYQRVWRLF
jgi:2-oxoglutarate dehydrogenase complex dehydrogenase (E1) component-like enzyme